MATYHLRKKCAICAPVKPTSDGRYIDKQPQKICDCWVDLEQLTSNERVLANQVHAGATHRAIIRWPGDLVEPAQYLERKDTGEQYPILGVRDLDGQYLELTLSAAQRPLGVETQR